MSTRHRDRVWRTIEATPDFWTTLKPLEDGAVKRLYQLTGEHNWEVFFITQRPATAGGTVQMQTHKWLVEHGFQTPSVIPLIQAISAINSQAPSRDHHSRSSSVVRLLARPMNNTPVSPAEAINAGTLNAA